MSTDRRRASALLGVPIASPARTVNKKYFKRISIEDLDRMRLPIEEKALSWTHENNTLIIQYRKPAEVLQREQQAKQERLTAPDEPAKPDGDVDCKQQ